MLNTPKIVLGVHPQTCDYCPTGEALYYDGTKAKRMCEECAHVLGGVGALRGHLLYPVTA